jgi:2-iminobutanoate/2-iminopropanoate deaminase
MKQPERQWQPVQLGGGVPAPVGAYSPAARAGGFVFVSGQVPRDPLSGNLVGDDIESQTRQVLANIARILESAGGSLADVVSITAYLANIDDWGRFNVVYRETMPSPHPSRTAIGADLRDILIEITAVAFLGDRAT